MSNRFWAALSVGMVRAEPVVVTGREDGEAEPHTKESTKALSPPRADSTIDGVTSSGGVSKDRWRACRLYLTERMLRPVAGGACVTARSFNGVPQSFGVVTHSGVARDDRHELRRLTEGFCRRDVHGIERPYRLHREALANTRQHVIRDRDHIAATFQTSQAANGTAFLVRREALTDARTHDGARSLRERQRGCDPPGPGAEGLQRLRVALQQRGNEGTRFDVPEGDGPASGRR